MRLNPALLLPNRAETPGWCWGPKRQSWQLFPGGEKSHFPIPLQPAVAMRSRDGPRNRALGQAHTIAALFGAESTRGPFRRPGPGAGQRWLPPVPKRRARPTEDAAAARKFSRSVGWGALGSAWGRAPGPAPLWEGGRWK